MTFEQWMQRLDGILIRTVGVTAGDLPDVCLHDWFYEGITPKQAAQLLIEEAMF